MLLFMLGMCIPRPGVAAPVSAQVVPGLNVIAVTAPLAAGQVSAFPLLTTWRPSGITVVESYDAANGRMLRAELDGGGNPSGSDFPLIENSALFVYATTTATLSLGDVASCAPLNLAAGFNLAGFACLPAPFTVSEFLNAVGLANIASISRLDTASGRWQTAAVDGGAVVGDDFPLSAGEGYVIHSGVVTGWTPPAATVIGLTPATLTVWQGQPGASLTVSLAVPAPSGGMAIDLVSSDPALVGVTTPVTVPQGAASVSVPLTLPDTGSVTPQAVTITASRTGMTIARSMVTVRPKPTINLSPLTSVTGLTLTYPLTVNLTDIAPPGGLPVTLTAAPTGIVTVPASVTIPAGASSAQVIVTALNTLGSATISATSPGRGISGAQNAVTVMPTQSMSYTPLTSSPIGVQVGPVYTPPTSQSMTYGPVTSAGVGVQVGDNPTQPTSVNASYASLASTEVGVAVGPVITGMSPNHGGIGDTAIPLTISGSGLNGVTAIAFQPSAGITVGSLSVAADGLSVSVPIDIAANATVGARTVLVSTASGIIMAGRGGADIFNVTLPAPALASITPLRSVVGQSVTMTIYGSNLTSASSVSLTPSTGITVSNPPTVNGGGTSLTVSFTIAANASLGDRVVTVTTPGGTTSTVAGVTNTFTITAASDPGADHTLATAEVGVMVQTQAAATEQNVSYGPVASTTVGVAVGATIRAVTPISGNIGASSLVVRVLGTGLSDASAISFQPPDGITIQPGSFAIGGDGNPQVTIDIAANAPVAPRTVLVPLSSGGYALPTDAGSNQFRVTLPVPEITSLQPIRAMVGQGVAMTIMGTNFGSASSVDFAPATGITVINPPTVNAAGTMITTSLTIAANAPLGDRLVTVTTPGGVTSAVATAANTFSITADSGTTYTPLLSSMVGVAVALPAASGQADVPYGPVASTEVGVMVTQATAASTQNVAYGPVVTIPVGVSVGGVFTGLSPGTLEPGASATFTLTGVGLDTVTSIAVIPPDNLTVTSWTPAGDGRSGTVTIAADAAAAQGTRTIVPLVGNTALPPAVPGTGIIQLGYRPVVNSITTTYPNSSVLALTGTSVTLTLNGSHLQGVTRVEVLPATGITIDTVPAWFSDATGEHVSVTVIVADNAELGDRLVRLSTPYGGSSSVRDVTNTLKVVDTLVNAPPAGNEAVRVAEADIPELYDRFLAAAVKPFTPFGVNGRRFDAALGPPVQYRHPHVFVHGVAGLDRERLLASAELPEVSRGPPYTLG